LHHGFQEIETALKNGSDTVQDLLDNIEQERQRVVNGILEAFPQTEKDRCSNESDIIILPEVTPLVPQLRELSELLKKHDVEAKDVYRSLEPKLTHASPKFSKELGMMLDKFDFASSRTRVETFITECEQKERADE